MLEILSNKYWLLEQGYLTRMLGILQGRSLESLIKKQTIADYLPRVSALLEFSDAPIHASGHDVGEVLMSYEMADSNGIPSVKNGGSNIAVIPVIGPLTKYGEACGYGMQDYQGMIAKANNDPTIDGIVLMIDSPGGSTDGTPEFGLSVKNSTKPIGVFADGTLASAAYWVASQSNVIVANKNNPTTVGSIGTYAAIPNIQNMVAAGNMPAMTIVRASKSTNKIPVNPIESLTEELTLAIQADGLDPINESFISTVKKARPNVTAKLDGTVYNTQDAKANGLIDSIGTLQTAINKVAELARARKSQNSNNGSNAQLDSMSKPNWLMSLFGKSEEQTASLTEEQAQELGKQEVASLKADLQKAQDEKATVEASMATLAAAKQSAEDKVAPLTTANAALQAELDKKPTGHATTIIADAAQEAAQANVDAAQKQKLRTPADKEADQYAQVANSNPFK